MLSVRCGCCGFRMDQPDDLAGQTIQCKQCYSVITIPFQSSQSVFLPDEPPGKPDYSRWGILLEALLQYEKTAPSVHLPE
ncbi:MAG: hypothetical protein JXA82_12105 [Sedimentisphaerales bacterium]|nr:hypothetical protein [Sedimentisphaerales bacterium]